ncbi:hypothetical protein [Leisingera sp. M658]|uniref:DUF7146 domain-containing protein n=1 Tax=Leisingera sp. M658 TaxID=2867015 RepID=UPI0021A74FAF|nr:hypothetical protein [Leisingera sp. M658]UWQ77370.1 hypothetical protein K3724_22810 [Leisingera sp. M658]
MNFPDDPRIADAKDIPVHELLHKLEIYGLTEKGGEMQGPCPECGDAGHNPATGPCDRFNVNIASKQWFCRKCKIAGGDQIELVREVKGCSFPEALEFLCGEKPLNVDPEVARKKRKKAEARARAEAARKNKWRQQSIDDARSIVARAGPGSRGIVGAYLRARGLSLDVIPAPLGYLLKHPYVVKRGGQNVTMHIGPCMIAPIVDWRTGLVMAVHQTWVDINPPHGKATIIYNGVTEKSKLTRGSVRGNFIPLITPADADTMVVAEGIENTLAAYLPKPPGFENAAYWAGVSLGNMAGKMLKSEKRGQLSGLPDMSAEEAFVPPPWVKRLVFIKDGDSDPVSTQKQLECGLLRARTARPGLRTGIVPAPAGFDMCDVLNGKHKQKHQERQANE